MATKTLDKLQQHLETEYPFHALADDGGGFVIYFPDLPGCITQADSLEEVPEMALDARRAWIESALEDGEVIPPPSHLDAYSGRFNVRLSRTLHRELVLSAELEGVSLNSYVGGLLAKNLSLATLERELSTLRHHVESIRAKLDYRVNVTRGSALRTDPPQLAA